VTTGHRSDRVNESEQHEAEGERDADRADQIEPANRTPDREEDKDERAQSFCNKLLCH